ncbi:glucosamine inositolphosphorylceramide transferase family protein [Clostridium perfringens]|uniref:glucosamine inositolphosphorylceramide transferase family protein n=1 Tax=Clostridium perfringens TaxID=1502 RepID=UPI000E18D5FA|nr:hypothetical protein [Clostridium perfringens]SUY38090.1 Uncharacterised protein [Clostridium perfringens]
MRFKIKNKLYYNESIWGIGICEINCFDEIYNLNKKFKQVLSNKDVTDTKAVFLADPFVIKKNNIWYLFFEVYEKKNKKGVIGLATSYNLKEWKYEKIILEEDFHLSYPYVIEEDGDIYMVPETGESGYIKIYKAIEFPYKWECVKNIVKGKYWDSSLFKFNNKWWMLSQTQTPQIDSLALFSCDSLLGEWKECEVSTIITKNKSISRPGGRVIINGNKIIRFAQDYSKYYGERVKAIEIKKLNENKYEENELGIVIDRDNTSNTWNKDGMHTIEIIKNKNDYFIIADGFYYKRINKIIDKIYSFLLRHK